MKPYKHQLELSTQGFAILKKHGLVYLNMEERTGKTLIGILIAETSPLIVRVLIITKKKALEGWNETLDEFPHLCSYTVINYHSVNKVKGDYDLIILDEAHNYISAFPKRKTIWNKVSKFTKGKPIIYMSATSSAQGRHLLFNQLALSSWSPWVDYKNGYYWHREYGIENLLYLHGRYIEQWNKTDNDRVWDECKHLFITKTRKELGFGQEPEDRIHYIELNSVTKSVYNEIQKDRMINLKAGLLIADTPMKLRTSLQSLEGGTIILKDENTGKPRYIVLTNREKVDYILKTWGDTNDMVIMHNYKAEKIKLEDIFENALILQATSYAEGIDLYKYKHLIIYSQDFSTARHTQRRARQANKNRKDEILVHYLLVKKAISEQVYDTVSINKTNFVDSTYIREEI